MGFTILLIKKFGKNWKKMQEVKVVNQRKTKAKCKWRLDIIRIEQIKLNPKITNYVDHERNYIFSESLAKRSQELKEAIERYAVVIWPIIVTGEDCMLVDGYCRYATLKMMNVKRIYTYIGIM
jgi:hypothetical protein